MKILWTVSFFLIWDCTVYANEIRTISVDEFNETIMPAIEKAERSIRNFEVELELSEQQKPLNSASDDWKDSGHYARVRVLSDGQRTGKIRIDVFIEKRGGRIIDERSYALCYNGTDGKVVLYGKTLKGERSEVKECIIFPSRSETIRSEMSAGLYANPLILNFLGYIRDGTFSEYLKRFMDPKVVPLLKKPPMNIALVRFENTECVRIQIEATGVVRVTYWLDPAKNYAPLAEEIVHRGDKGKEVVTSFKKVLKFKKLSKSIWFPVRTQIEMGGLRIAVRKTITVSKVKANIQGLKDADFDLCIPDGYKIICGN